MDDICSECPYLNENGECENLNCEIFAGEY